MNQNLKANERELVKVATFFKRFSKDLLAKGRLGEEFKSVAESVDRFVSEMERHADSRAAILSNRQELSKLVKDHAVCPRCNSNDKLKLAGTEKNDKGWTSNRYRCRKCNITFTWNRPNNPWDMIGYLTDLLDVLRLKRNNSTGDQQARENDELIRSMEGNVESLRSAIGAHDQEYHAMIERDTEMEKLIHEFKNTLLIEKIKMDTWENKKQNPA